MIILEVIYELLLCSKPQKTIYNIINILNVKVLVILHSENNSELNNFRIAFDSAFIFH